MSEQTWNCPAVDSLLAELPEPVEVNPRARIIVSSDTNGTLTLRGADACKILASETEVESFYDAIERESTCMVEVTGFDVEEDVKAKLEELFEYVEI